ncbi:MAG: rubredoxin [Deltaproteobacteria bacterium]|nr:rubredoxin [Deltaproteobacteria bacterium]
MSDTTQYECEPCGFIYDENYGHPASGIEPGTKWEDVPDDWRCPLCGAGKEEFAPL